MDASACISWILLSLSTIVRSVNPESILGESNEDFDFDGLPGVQHEFKVEVSPGREECFFQRIKQAAQLHISFEVLRGADRNIDIMIRGPMGEIIDSHQWTREGSTDKQVDKEGIYAVCIDNTFSRFSSKLVYFYLVTYVIEEWHRFTKDLQQFDISVDNVTESLKNVDLRVNQMRRAQALSRQHAITDWYIITSNEAYIQNWSILMNIVIIATTALQVFFVRRLFATHNITPTSSKLRC